MKAPGLRLTTPPSVEPLTLPEAKSWLRVDVADDDTLITDLIKDAREFVENHTAMALLTQTWLYTMDYFPPLDMSYMLIRQPRAWLPQTRQFQGSGGGVIRLPLPPLQSVVAVRYADPDTGALLTADPSTWQVDTTSFPGRLAPAYGQVWPVTRFQPAAVQVTFTAGWGDTGDAVPGIYKRAVRMLVACWYENRGDNQARVQAVENGVRSLLMQGWYGEQVG